MESAVWSLAVHHLKNETTAAIAFLHLICWHSLSVARDPSSCEKHQDFLCRKEDLDAAVLKAVGHQKHPVIVCILA